MSLLLSFSPAELVRRQPWFAAAAWLCLAALVPVGMAFALDERTINGINIWTKPAKFLVSFTFYYATLAWAAGFLPAAAQRTVAGRFAVGAALAGGLYEMLWLLVAAANGVPSHFNFASAAWRTAYHVAGFGALMLIAAILAQGLQIARDRRSSTPPPLRDALVLGAVISFAGTLVTAGFLASGTGHWIGGVHSDAAGLPFFGWSSSGGDLRVAHFFALHAQQAVPLAGAALLGLRVPRARVAVWSVALAYLCLITFTFLQAAGGHPFLASFA